MKRLAFEYAVDIKFDAPVTDHQFQLRCVPQDGIFQHVESVSYIFSPVDQVTWLRDGFNNVVYVGSSIKSHTEFSFHVSGIVVTSQQPLSIDNTCPLIYKYATPLTKLNRQMKSFANQFVYTKDKVFECAHAIHEYMTYQPASTNISTTAIEAFTQQKGVCQDYTHILLGMLRYLDIPCRYVVGMMIGEGATHAWVEAYIDQTWVGIDPTNDCYVDENYIRLSWGRDYHDCIIDKGTFFGRCNQEQTIVVKVSEIK